MLWCLTVTLLWHRSLGVWGVDILDRLNRLVKERCLFYWHLVVWSLKAVWRPWIQHSVDWGWSIGIILIPASWRFHLRYDWYAVSIGQVLLFRLLTFDNESDSKFPKVKEFCDWGFFFLIHLSTNRDPDQLKPKLDLCNTALCVLLNDRCRIWLSFSLQNWRGLSWARKHICWCTSIMWLWTLVAILKYISCRCWSHGPTHNRKHFFISQVTYKWLQVKGFPEISLPLSQLSS